MTLRHVLTAATILAAPALLGSAAHAQPVTGLYIGAGAGGNILQTERDTFSLSSPFAAMGARNIHYQVGGVGVASVGYGFGNGLRLEGEADIRHNRVREYSGTAFPTNAGGDRFTYAGMVNALFDLDIGSPYVFPYLGVGAGYAETEYDAAHAYGTNFPFRLGSRDRTQGSFAYQGIIGASFPIPPVVGLSLTAEYRFFSTVEDRYYGFRSVSAGVPAAGRFQERQAYDHSLLLGVRYAFNVAPPPPPAVPVSPAAPAAALSRTYLVFFDWDRADLTARARQIIAEAAQASSRVQVTRIEVNGYTDLSGTPRYNQALSLRRAGAVAAELVRNGVPRGAIATQGFGEGNPLVPTAQGVREPQNRRVEIVLR